MSFSQETAVKRAKEDLSSRIGVAESDIDLASVEEKDFPDMSLGAPMSDEMSAQMISSGWAIVFDANGEEYEYRADKYQLRLVNYMETNHVIVS